MRLAAIFWALFLFGICGRAHADTADDAVRFFCGPGHSDLAAPIREASKRWMVRPQHLAVTMAAESSCRWDSRNERTGAAGLFGIMPGRSADPQRLPYAKLIDPRTNTNLGARHLSGLLTLCGSFAGAAHVYHSKDGKCRNWRTDKHVAKLLTWERAFWRWVRASRQARS